jgi:hypothetical protein
MDITRFRELLDAKGVRTASCPTCGANAWGGLDSHVLLPIRRMEPLPEDGDHLAEDTVTALGATCGQCGFISMFDLSVLDEDSFDLGQYGRRGA